MRSVFAIAPLAIMLAWLNPHTGVRSNGLAGAPVVAWATDDAPAPSPASAASLPMVAYGSEPDATRQRGNASVSGQPRAASGNLLVNAAVVR